VRDENDQWIRVAVKKGGMIVLPAGMYHRFTLDNDNYIKVHMCYCTIFCWIIALVVLVVDLGPRNAWWPGLWSRSGGCGVDVIEAMHRESRRCVRKWKGEDRI